MLSTGTLAEAFSHAAGGPGLVLVDGRAGYSALTTQPGSIPVVIVGVGDDEAPASTNPVLDVAVRRGGPALAAVVEAVNRTPVAASSLAVLLRDARHRSVEAGLAAESSVYSLLQAGPEFRAWQESAPPRRPDDAEGPAVIVERQGATMTVVLDRPARHNAFSAAMRDGLCSALQEAIVDDEITSIHLRGNGPSFSSGGDLSEFGSFSDPASAHALRLTRSAGRLVHRLAPRVEAHLHGACIGAGIEIPAFAGRVHAAVDVRISLPELALGLVPGAGGTVSLPRRIGRHRTAWLALTGLPIDAPTARGWGLVDNVE